MVVPHHKKVDKYKVENFRPVCHLIEMGKIVELVVLDQLLGHFVTHKLIHPNHHGSMPSHDCVTAVGHLKDTVTREADSKLMSAVMILDQSSAYDLVDHRTLLQKMKGYNFSQETAKWFGS